jgi:hypothetical protein
MIKQRVQKSDPNTQKCIMNKRVGKRGRQRLHSNQDWHKEDKFAPKFEFKEKDSYSEEKLTN